MSCAVEYWTHNPKIKVKRLERKNNLSIANWLKSFIDIRLKNCIENSYSIANIHIILYLMHKVLIVKR